MGLKARGFLASAATLFCLVASVAPGASSTTGWPQLGRDPSHSFHSTDPKVTVGAAKHFGVKWMANLYSADLGSPVAAFNSVLGKTVVYVGNNRADVVAVDGSTGQTLWSTNVGLNDKLQATPMVAPDGTVWAATSYNAAMYKLDGATGKVLCTIKSPSGLPVNGSPMVVTPAGGVMTVYWDTIDAGKTPGPTIATRESDCKTLFTFTKYLTLAGPWATPAYGLTAAGEPLVVVGTADPDSTEYAIDALTGALVWHYTVSNPKSHSFDIGDASTISPPGNNGFASGVAYVDSKYGIEYANDLATGANLWQFTITSSRSSAALDGNALVVGSQSGVYDLNATTGTMNWRFATPAEVISSPAIVGPAGSEIVAVGDVSGAFRILGLAGGDELYKYQTGGFVTGSVAEANGTLFESSSDGFLYAYGAGGGNGAPPTTAITYPANLSTIPNPNGNVTIAGTSSDPTGVSAVEVAIQSNGVSGPWYNATTGVDQPTPVRNAGTLANPGAKTTAWSLVLPAPAGGGTFTIFASSVNTGHIVDRGATSNFTITPSKGEPNIRLSALYVSPGGAFSATATAFRPHEKVVYTLQGAAVGTGTATATGFVPEVDFTVPTTDTFGPTSLTATGQTSHKVTTATIGIINQWPQLGHDSQRSGFEVNDPLIKDSISVGPHGTVLSQAWDYRTGAAVNSSPAIANGIAYVGNDAGLMSAIVTNTGAPKWSFSIPSGAPIRSSPAIDGDGNVIFGADDGNLYRLTNGGTLEWTTSLGGKLSSPAQGVDRIYIGSDNGKFADVNDTTGAIVWTDTVAGAVRGAPAFDPVAKIVIVGDDSGAVTAFSSDTGAKLWTRATGGPVAGAPLINGNTVYIGSADANFYALDESTGAVKWQHAVDGPIVSGAATFLTHSTSFTVGTRAGTVYRFSPAGDVLYTFSHDRFHNSPIVGIAGVEGNTFAETSSGFNGMIRMNGNTPILLWEFQTKGALTTSPAIVDGTLYVGAGDGGLYAFTPHGTNPIPAATPAPAIIVRITNAWSCSTQP